MGVKMHLLIFLDELYYKGEGGTYVSPFNAGRFILELKKWHKLTFTFPTASNCKNEKNLNTSIPSDTHVIPFPEWRTILEYAENYYYFNKKINQLLSERFVLKMQFK